MTIATDDVIHHKPIRALLRANWRNYRVPVLALIIVGAAIYLLGIIVYLRSDDATRTIDRFRYALADTSMVAIAFSTLIAAALGGMSIANERADRTALFVAMLPVKRMQIAFTKLALSTVIMISALMVHLLVAGSALLMQWRRLQQATLPSQNTVQLSDILGQHVEPLFMFVALAFSMFCLAWLLGSFSRSAVISACSGIAITLAAVILLATYASEHGDSMSRYFADRQGLGIALLCLGIGAPSLIAGTIIYVKRVEP